MTVLGNLALWVALLFGVWAGLVGFVGGVKGRADLQRSARNAVFASCGSLLLAVFALEWALFHHDFNVEYVAAYTSRNLPIFYTWSALYAGQKGSLLFWATVLSLFGSLAQVLTARRHRVYLPYVAGVVGTVTAFFVTVMVFAANPFGRLPYTPADGSGLNPQLQNPGMVFHPPMLYLGYISMTIPFAFAIAALVCSRSRPWSRSSSTRTGWSRSGSGRSYRGCSSRSAWCSACGGRTSSWDGAATGRGIPSRTRRCSPGSP